MAMVCPQCNQSYDQQLQCPTCGVRLLYHAKIRPSVDDTSGLDTHWQHTPWGRIVVGVILAQGLAHGLQYPFTAGIQAAGDAASWATPRHQILLQALQGFSLLVGGVLTGAGRRRGVFFGSVVGLVHGLIFLGIQQCNGAAVTEVMLYAVPVLHMAFGAAGGLVGSLIWRPLPIVRIPRSDADEKPERPRLVRGGFTFLAGPVAWVRVLTGSAFVVAGVLWAPWVLHFVLLAGNHILALTTAPWRMSITPGTQSSLVTWEMAALVTFLGASFAGATTSNGFKQGLCVGLGAGACLAGLEMAKQTPDMDRALFLIVSALLLCVGGGWFGGQLFPPIRARARRRMPSYFSETC
jgi:hypothetical protein